MSTSAMAEYAAFYPVGEPIPDADHAVSVSLPTWKSNVAYEEGEEWVLQKMQNGYPRFFIHGCIVAFQESLLDMCGMSGEDLLLFPCASIARRCADFIKRLSSYSEKEDHLACRILVLVPNRESHSDSQSSDYRVDCDLSAIFFDKRDVTLARKFWQHTGDGVSSRRAMFFKRIFDEGKLFPQDLELSSTEKSAFNKGPKRYRKDSNDEDEDASNFHELDAEELEFSVHKEPHKFVEERFGRNLDLSLAAKAKLALRRRIAGLIVDEDLSHSPIPVLQKKPIRSIHGLSHDHVFLFPCGMSAIYNTHRMLSVLRGSLRSIMYGFPYIDTLKVLEKFGGGALFYGNGSASDLDDLERQCKSGEKFLALFCEFPGNPLLQTPDLRRIRKLADQYDFMVVVDETIGNFLNVNVLPVADVVVSSLTKVFSGDSNVMGGSLVLNPESKHFTDILGIVQKLYVDHLWCEDAIFLERNSRDFMDRNQRINHNAEVLAELLHQAPEIKRLNYPKFNNSRSFFEDFRNASGGYTGLLSVTFYSNADAVRFYDALATAKGPSLGTNFTLSSPFVILAHYLELDWVKQYGVEPDLVRVSVGLEPTEHLVRVFQKALATISNR